MEDQYGYELGDSDHPMGGIPPDVMGRALRNIEFRHEVMNDPVGFNVERQQAGLPMLSGRAVAMLQGLNAANSEGAIDRAIDEAIGSMSAVIGPK